LANVNDNFKNAGDMISKKVPVNIKFNQIVTEDEGLPKPVIKSQIANNPQGQQQPQQQVNDGKPQDGQVYNPLSPNVQGGNNPGNNNANTINNNNKPNNTTQVR